MRTSDIEFEGDFIIRTLPDATVELAGSWIQEELKFVPDKCILSCGLHDILEGLSPSVILDRLGSVIANLKHSNENIQIYVCELLPSAKYELDSKINDYNKKLIEWSVTNGVTVIKINLSFKYGTGEVDCACFMGGESVSDVEYLNRKGVLRLLTAVSKQCMFFKVKVGWARGKKWFEWSQFSAGFFCLLWTTTQE